MTTVPRIGYLVRRHSGHRGRTGYEARIRSRERVLEMHADYFAAHPRARAFAWKRIGLMAAGLGDHRKARIAFLKSLAARPTAKTLGHLARSIQPQKTYVPRQVSS